MVSVAPPIEATTEKPQRSPSSPQAKNDGTVPDELRGDPTQQMKPPGTSPLEREEAGSLLARGRTSLVEGILKGSLGPQLGRDTDSVYPFLIELLQFFEVSEETIQQVLALYFGEADEKEAARNSLLEEFSQAPEKRNTEEITKYRFREASAFSPWHSVAGAPEVLHFGGKWILRAHTGVPGRGLAFAWSVTDSRTTLAQKFATICDALEIEEGTIFSPENDPAHTEEFEMVSCLRIREQALPAEYWTTLQVAQHIVIELSALAGTLCNKPLNRILDTTNSWLERYGDNADELFNTIIQLSQTIQDLVEKPEERKKSENKEFNSILASLSSCGKTPMSLMLQRTVTQACELAGLDLYSRRVHADLFSADQIDARIFTDVERAKAFLRDPQKYWRTRTVRLTDMPLLEPPPSCQTWLGKTTAGLPTNNFNLLHWLKSASSATILNIFDCGGFYPYRVGVNRQRYSGGFDPAILGLSTLAADEIMYICRPYDDPDTQQRKLHSLFDPTIRAEVGKGPGGWTVVTNDQERLSGLQQFRDSRDIAVFVNPLWGNRSFLPPAFARTVQLMASLPQEYMLNRLAHTVVTHCLETQRKQTAEKIDLIRSLSRHLTEDQHNTQRVGIPENVRSALSRLGRCLADASREGKLSVAPPGAEEVEGNLSTLQEYLDRIGIIWNLSRGDGTCFIYPKPRTAIAIQQLARWEQSKIHR
ncbi:hypothetical protein JW710_00170 [Candidatus Dojkabacteria bacterium]|nr:hypothetical protein [Candidatus Dojkabacteria bacterium]